MKRALTLLAAALLAAGLATAQCTGGDKARKEDAASKDASKTTTKAHKGAKKGHKGGKKSASTDATTAGAQDKPGGPGKPPPTRPQ